MAESEDPTEFERFLEAHRVPGPGPGLRGRVLDAIRAELARVHAPLRARPALWRFAAAAAGIALVWANLSLSAANVTRPLGTKGAGGGDLRDQAARLRDQFPELSGQDALREALLAEMRGGMVPLPRLERGSHDSIPLQEK